MIFDFDFRSAESYRLFKEIRRLPRYQVKGRSIWVPNEYADRLGVNAVNADCLQWSPSPFLHDYQRDIAARAIEQKCFAVFADCGLGKTLILLEYALACRSFGKRVLIVSPLMVVKQTADECERFHGFRPDEIRAADLQGWLNTSGAAIGITNYEAIRDDLQPGNVGAIVLDESSMLKSHYGAYGTRLIELGRGLEYKLALTGTPAPNDRIEFANHAVFLNRHRTVNEFLARYFVNRGQTQNRWEIKPHAIKPFYRDLSAWCIFLSDPAVYGWKAIKSIPPIHIKIERIPMTDEQNAAVRDLTGQLMSTSTGGIGQRSKLSQIAKGRYKDKAIPTRKFSHIRSMVDSWPDESTIIWCRFNDEQDRLGEAFPEAANISGSTPMSERQVLLDWFLGRICTCERQKRIANICGHTTKTTSTDGSLARKNSKTNTTKPGASDTPKTKRSSRKQGQQPSPGKSEIPTSGLPSDSSRTGSRQPSTSPCLTDNKENARSAGAKGRLTPGQPDCTLITATQQEKCEGSCAETAITESGSSPTAQNCSRKQRCTCDLQGRGRVLISKARVLGFGLNLQVATRQVFSSCDDSYEEFYQAVKRSNRIGSTRPLNVHIAITEIEEPMVENVLNKASRVESDTREQELMFKELSA